MKALVDACSEDQRYLGATIGGSVARGDSDRHSDLDLVLVCREADHASLLAELPTLAARCGPLLNAFTGEHVGEPRLLIALYGPPLLHVDLKLVAACDLRDRVEDGTLLWEREGAVTELWDSSEAVWPRPSSQWIEDRFWTWIHYGAGHAARGELFECLGLLGMLRELVFGPLLAELYDQPAQGVRRLERFAPDEAEALARTIGDHDRESCFEALQIATGLYRDLRDRLDDPTVVRRAAAEREVVAHLEGLRSERAP